MKYFYLLVFLASVSLTETAFAQCSDAGVCELSRHDNTLKEPKLIADLRYGLGTSGKPENITFQQVSAGVEYHLTKHFYAIAEVPYRVQTFSNTSISGFGDIFLMGKYIVSNDIPSEFKDGEEVLFPRSDAYWDFQLGVKLPAGAVNEDTLPTPYQNGLGTTDLLAGIQYTSEDKFHSIDYTGGLGLQLPFGQSSNRIDSLKRGPDLLLQGAVKKKWLNLWFSGELLGILPLKKSIVNTQFIETTESSPDPIIVSDRTEVPHSNQFQLNLLLSGTYLFNESASIEVGVGVPLLKRDHNEDGLRREFTFYTTLRQGIF